MSIAAMNWAWSVPDLNPTERLTLLALADYAGPEGECWPFQETLADKVGVSKRTVVTTLQRLEERGLFTRAHQAAANGRGRTADRYFLDLSADVSRETNGTTKVQSAALIGEPPVNPSANAEVVAKPRPSRIPEPFMVTREMWAWLSEEGITPEFGNEQTVIFVDYWRGRTGQIAVKADWPATWRNWMRRAWKDGSSRARLSGPVRETPDERFRRLMAQAEAMENGQAAVEA